MHADSAAVVIHSRGKEAQDALWQEQPVPQRQLEARMNAWCTKSWFSWADHVILDRWTTNPNGTATGWLLWWMKAQISTDTILSRASSIYMIQLRRRTRRQSNNKLRRKLRSQDKPKQAKTDRKSHYKRPQQQNEFNYTSKRCTRYTDTCIQTHRLNRYADAQDTDTHTHTAVAGLKSLQEMEERRRRRRRSTRVFWCLQARNWIKLKTKRNWKHTHTDTVLYICMYVCVCVLFIFC